MSNQGKKPPIDYYFNIESTDWPFEIFLRDLELENPDLEENDYFASIKRSFREKTDKAERAPLIDIEKAMGPRYKPVISEKTPPIAYNQRTPLSMMYFGTSPLSPILKEEFLSYREGWHTIRGGPFVAVKFEPVSRNRFAYNRIVVTGRGQKNKYIEKHTNFYVLRWKPLIIARWFDPSQNHWEVTNFGTRDMSLWDTSRVSLPVPLRLNNRSTLNSYGKPRTTIPPLVRNAYVWVPGNSEFTAEIMHDRRLNAAVDAFYEFQRKTTYPSNEEDIERIALKHGVTPDELIDAVNERIQSRRRAKELKQQSNEFIEFYEKHYIPELRKLPADQLPPWARMKAGLMTDTEMKEYVQWVEENLRVAPEQEVEIEAIQVRKEILPEEPEQEQPAEEETTSEENDTVVSKTEGEPPEEGGESQSLPVSNFEGMTDKQVRKTQRRNDKLLKRQQKKLSKKRRKGKV